MRALHLLDRISKEFTNDQLDLYLRYIRLHEVVQNLHQLGTGGSIADALRKQSAALHKLHSELQARYPQIFQQPAEEEDHTKLMKFRNKNRWHMAPSNNDSDANKCKLCYKQTSGPAELAAASHIHSSVYKLIGNYYQLYIHVIKSVQSLKLKYISSRM